MKISKLAILLLAPLFLYSEVSLAKRTTVQEGVSLFSKLPLGAKFDAVCGKDGEKCIKITDFFELKKAIPLTDSVKPPCQTYKYKIPGHLLYLAFDSFGVLIGRSIINILVPTYFDPSIFIDNENKINLKRIVIYDPIWKNEQLLLTDKRHLFKIGFYDLVEFNYETMKRSYLDAVKAHPSLELKAMDHNGKIFSFLNCDVDSIISSSEKVDEYNSYRAKYNDTTIVYKLCPEKNHLISITYQLPTSKSQAVFDSFMQINPGLLKDGFMAGFSINKDYSLGYLEYNKYTTSGKHEITIYTPKILKSFNNLEDLYYKSSVKQSKKESTRIEIKRDSNGFIK